jgi:hypothetical protein
MNPVRRFRQNYSPPAKKLMGYIFPVFTSQTTENLKWLLLPEKQGRLLEKLHGSSSTLLTAALTYWLSVWSNYCRNSAFELRATKAYD